MIDEIQPAAYIMAQANLRAPQGKPVLRLSPYSMVLTTQTSVPLAPHRAPAPAFDDEHGVL